MLLYSDHSYEVFKTFDNPNQNLTFQIYFNMNGIKIKRFQCKLQNCPFTIQQNQQKLRCFNNLNTQQVDNCLFISEKYTGGWGLKFENAGINDLSELVNIIEKQNKRIQTLEQKLNNYQSLFNKLQQDSKFQWLIEKQSQCQNKQTNYKNQIRQKNKPIITNKTQQKVIHQGQILASIKGTQINKELLPFTNIPRICQRNPQYVVLFKQKCKKLCIAGKMIQGDTFIEIRQYNSILFLVNISGDYLPYDMFIKPRTDHDCQILRKGNKIRLEKFQYKNNSAIIQRPDHTQVYDLYTLSIQCQFLGENITGQSFSAQKFQKILKHATQKEKEFIKSVKS